MADRAQGAQYSAQQFIDAIPGTGGVVSALAEKVGCAWHTAKKYIDNYATVRAAWEAERSRITDIAENNIIKALKAGDLSMSKWWLQVMREEFTPREKREIVGEGGGPLIVEYVNDWRGQGNVE
jgi:hypothetical protein